MAAPIAISAPKRFSLLPGELWGGGAAMLVALPSSIAFGIAIYVVLGKEYVGLGALAGIVGAMMIGVVSSLCGGAPRLISAPCAPAAAVLGAFALDLIQERLLQPAQAAAALMLVGCIAALLQILYGTIGGGKLIKFIPYPVVAGYLSGVGVLILISQLPKLLGVGKDLAFWDAVLFPQVWKWQAIVVGSVTIAGMVLAPRFIKSVPGAIIGLLAGVLAYFGLGLFQPELLRLAGNPLVIGPLFEGNASLFGSLAERYRAWGSLDWRTVKFVLVPAITLSALLSIDTLKTCVVLDVLTRSRHNSNRVLIGQGLGNLASALAGGVPGAGTMGATLVNLNSGGKTAWSGVFEGGFVVVALAVFGQWLGWIPIAALAGILLVVACRMVDLHSLHLLKHRATILDFAVIATVIVVAVTVDLIAASATGVVLAVFLFIREQILGSVIRRKVRGDQISSKQYRLAWEKELLRQAGRQVTVCELQGSLFFGTTDKLFSELEPDLKTSRVVILDLQRIQSVDFTAVHLLEQIEDMLAEHNGFLLFSNLPAHLPTGQDLNAYFSQVGLLRAGRKVQIFESLDEALEWAEERVLAERKANATEEAPVALREMELFKDAPSANFVSALEACLEVRRFQAGEVIFTQGELDDRLYLIRRGLVRIKLDLEGGRHYLLGVFGRGNFFGEIAFLDQGLRSADAVAGTDTELCVLSRKAFDELARQEPALAAEFFSRLARGLALRLRYTDSELRALKEA